MQMRCKWRHWIQKWRRQQQQQQQRLPLENTVDHTCPFSGRNELDWIAIEFRGASIVWSHRQMVTLFHPFHLIHPFRLFQVSTGLTLDEWKEPSWRPPGRADRYKFIFFRFVCHYCLGEMMNGRLSGRTVFEICCLSRVRQGNVTSWRKRLTTVACSPAARYVIHLFIYFSMIWFGFGGSCSSCRCGFRAVSEQFQSNFRAALK